MAEEKDAVGNGKPVSPAPNEEDVENELTEAAVIKPPDGGYGWVIVFASFLANVLVDGVIFTAGGALQSLWVTSFNTTESAVSFACSFLAGCYLLSGPLASALANHFGCRAVVIAGAFVSFFGFIGSTVSPNVAVLYMSFGIIGGIGFGLVYLPAIVIVSLYFAERRALATGLAVCGSGIGTTIFAALNPLVMKICENNWRTFMVFFAVSALLCIICGVLFRPLEPTEQQIEQVAKIAAEYEAWQPESGIVADDVGEEQTLSPLVTPGAVIERFPTAEGGRPRFNSNRPFLSTLELNASKTRNKNVWSQSDLVTAVAHESVQELNRPLSRMDVFYPGSTQNIAVRSRAATGVTEGPRSRQESMGAGLESNVYLSTIGLPSAADGTGEAPSWTEGFIAVLKSLLDTSLLLSPSFMILAVSGFLTLSCFYVPYIYNKKHLEKISGLTDYDKGLPTMLLGIINIVARILCGFIADLPEVDALTVSNIALICGGTATFFVPFYTKYWMFIAFCVPFAFGAGWFISRCYCTITACFAALRSVICVEMFGVEKLSNAYGILLLFMGFGALIGSPLAAFISDISGNFNLSYYVMGGMMTLSGIVCLPLRRLRRWEIERENAKNKGLAAQDTELQPLKNH